MGNKLYTIKKNEMPTTFTLLRHAQGTHNVNHFNKQSQYNDPIYIDAELTQEGMNQAVAARNTLSKEFDAIYCSPLRRCRSTLLGVLPDSQNRIVIVDDRLIEQPCGVNICNKRFERNSVVESCPPLWNVDNVSATNPFLIKSPDEDKKKIYNFTKEVRAKYPNGHVLIVAHCEWINRWSQMFQMRHANLENCEHMTVSL